MPERNETNQMWRDVREGRRANRNSWHERDGARLAALEQAGAIYVAHFTEDHKRIGNAKTGKEVDYWPRTGAIVIRRTDHPPERAARNGLTYALTLLDINEKKALAGRTEGP